jgi:hypothetical protein
MISIIHMIKCRWRTGVDLPDRRKMLAARNLHCQYQLLLAKCQRHSGTKGANNTKRQCFISSLRHEFPSFSGKFLAVRPATAVVASSRVMPAQAVISAMPQLQRQRKASVAYLKEFI